MDVSNVQTTYTSYPINTGNNPVPSTVVSQPTVGGGVGQVANVSVDLTTIFNEGLKTLIDLTKTGQNLLHDLANAHHATQSTAPDLWSKPMVMLDELAAVIIKQAANESSASLDEARNQADSAKAELMNQAASLRKEAGEMMSGAIASLVMTVVSSAISLASAGAQLKELGSVKKQDMDHVKLEEGEKIKYVKKEGSQEPQKVLMTEEEQAAALAIKKEKLQANDYQNQIQRANSEVGAMNMIGSALSQLAGGVGNFINTFYQAEAKETEAEGAEDSANAQQLQSYADESQKIADDMKKLVDQITSILKEIADSKAQMMQSMTRV